jgi:predicted nuclease with TOPRIM domain
MTDPGENAETLQEMKEMKEMKELIAALTARLNAQDDEIKTLTAKNNSEMQEMKAKNNSEMQEMKAKNNSEMQEMKLLNAALTAKVIALEEGKHHESSSSSSSNVHSKTVSHDLSLFITILHCICLSRYFVILPMLRVCWDNYSRP